MGAGALASSVASHATVAQASGEGADTPKICLPVAALDEAGMRGVKQLGVDHVVMGGPPIPWDESAIRARMDRLRSAGLTLGNMMIAGFPNAIYGRPGRDEEIEKVRHRFAPPAKRASR